MPGIDLHNNKKHVLFDNIMHGNSNLAKPIVSLTVGLRLQDEMTKGAFEKCKGAHIFTIENWTVG